MVDLLDPAGRVGAVLVGAERFTNAVEWFGHKLGLGEGAVGSVLAAVGTALPETTIPVVAILFSGGTAHRCSGSARSSVRRSCSPRWARGVTGVVVLLARRRRATGLQLNVDAGIVWLGHRVFARAYALAAAAEFLPREPSRAKLVVAAVLVVL